MPRNPSASISEKQLAQTRLAIASTRLETLRTMPYDLGYASALECLQAFALVHALDVPAFREYAFREGAQKRLELLLELPALLGFKTAQHLITALHTAHGLQAKRRILTPDKIDRLIELTAQNSTREAIAAELGCAPQTVSNVRNELGIKQTESVRTAPSLLGLHTRLLLELTAQGLDSEQCAAAMGCAKTSITWFRRQLGISHANRATRITLARQKLQELDDSERKRGAASGPRAATGWARRHRQGPDRQTADWMRQLREGER